jgi:hypothetical protein
LHDGRARIAFCAARFASFPSHVHRLILRGTDAKMLGFFPVVRRRNKLIQSAVSRRRYQEPVKRNHRNLRQERGHVLSFHYEKPERERADKTGDEIEACNRQNLIAEEALRFAEEPARHNAISNQSEG